MSKTKCDKESGKNRAKSKERCCTADNSCLDECMEEKICNAQTCNENNSSEIEDLKKEIEDLKEKVLLAKADGINMLERTSKGFSEKIHATESSVIKDLLSIFDYYQKGMDYAKTLNSPDVKNLIFGFEMVQKQLEDFFKSYKVKLINVNGEIFDPERHNPITAVEDENQKDNVVTKQFIPLYTRNDKVLRQASVEITKPAEKNSSNDKAKEEIIEEEKKEVE